MQLDLVGDELDQIDSIWGGEHGGGELAMGRNRQLYSCRNEIENHVLSET